MNFRRTLRVLSKMCFRIRRCLELSAANVASEATTNAGDQKLQCVFLNWESMCNLQFNSSKRMRALCEVFHVCAALLAESD